MTVLIAAAIVIPAITLALIVDSMRRISRKIRRAQHVAMLSADDMLAAFCWTYLRDEAYRRAISITLARHGAVRVEDLAPLLERAREFAVTAERVDEVHSVRVPPRLEVVR